MDSRYSNSLVWDLIVDELGVEVAVPTRWVMVIRQQWMLFA